MEPVTSLPAGNLIVFLLAGTIAAAAFIARRYETRRPAPRARVADSPDFHAPYRTRGARCRYRMS